MAYGVVEQVGDFAEEVRGDYEQSGGLLIDFVAQELLPLHLERDLRWMLE